MSEWTRPAQPVRCVVELDKPLAVHRERGVLAQGDENANAIVAEVYSTAGKPYDLSGCTVQLIFVRPDNNALPAIDAEISGNTATATLPDGAYAMSGTYSLRMQLRKNGAERTIVWIIGEVKSTDVDGIADPEHVISIGDIMASAKEAQTAASNANTAAARANAGAERAEQLQIDASGLAGDSNKLGGKPPSYYLPAQNLFINPDFAIAQAGYNAMHGAIKYAADCWINENNLSVVEADSGINVTLTNSSAEIAQYIPKHVAKSVAGQPVTMALLLGNGVVCVANGIVPDEGSYSSFIYSVDNNILLKATYLPEGTIRAGFASGDDVWRDVNVRYVRFLPGTYTADTLQPFVPRPHAVELAECQRYLWGSKTGFNASGAATADGTQFDIMLTLPQPMIDNGKTISIVPDESEPYATLRGAYTYDKRIDMSRATILKDHGNIVVIRAPLAEGSATANTTGFVYYDYPFWLSKDL